MRHLFSSHLLIFYPDRPYPPPLESSDPDNLPLQAILRQGCAPCELTHMKKSVPKVMR